VLYGGTSNATGPWLYRDPATEMDAPVRREFGCEVEHFLFGHVSAWALVKQNTRNYCHVISNKKLLGSCVISFSPENGRGGQDGGNVLPLSTFVLELAGVAPNIGGHASSVLNLRKSFLVPESSDILLHA
jgi:hypothetical protein